MLERLSEELYLVVAVDAGEMEGRVGLVVLVVDGELVAEQDLLHQPTRRVVNSKLANKIFVLRRDVTQFIFRYT